MKEFDTCRFSSAKKLGWWHDRCVKMLSYIQHQRPDNYFPHLMCHLTSYGSILPCMHCNSISLVTFSPYSYILLYAKYKATFTARYFIHNSHFLQFSFGSFTSIIGTLTLSLAQFSKQLSTKEVEVRFSPLCVCLGSDRNMFFSVQLKLTGDDSA